MNKLNKENRVNRLVIGVGFFTIIYLSGNYFFDFSMGLWEIFLLSVVNSFGIEFVVPSIVKWMKIKGWVS